MYTGMTSREIIVEWLQWLTLRKGSRWLVKSQRWSINRPALLLAPLPEAEDAALRQQEAEQVAEEEEVEEEAMAAVEAGDMDRMLQLMQQLQLSEEPPVVAAAAEEEEAQQPAAVGQQQQQRARPAAEPLQLIRAKQARQMGAFAIEAHVAETRINACKV